MSQPAQIIRIGLLRLLDSAPVLLADQQGYFTQAGLAATLLREPSWANIADKLAYGLLDAAIMPGPLALAIMLGLRGRATALHIAGLLSREGNAVVMANLASANIVVPHWATVHIFSNHTLLLRRVFAERGITPAAMLALPPAEMTNALAQGRITGFCAGAPWGAHAAAQGAGTIIASSASLAPNHPEKFIVLRADFAAAHPTIAAALRDALSAATLYGQQPEQSDAIAHFLAAPDQLNLPHPLLAAALRSGQGNPIFMTGVDVRPHADEWANDWHWTITQMQHAAQFSTAQAAQARRLILTNDKK